LACRSHSVSVVGTRGLEDPGVTVAVASRERLHHPVDLLRFSRETKAPQKLPARRERRHKNPQTRHNTRRLEVNSNLSACTRFRSENSCRPTNAFRVCRCISSLSGRETKKKNQPDMKYEALYQTQGRGKKTLSARLEWRSR